MDDDLSEQWLSIRDPIRLTYPLLQFPSVREWRLCLAAFCRRVPLWMSEERIRAAVDLVERLADGEASEDERERALKDRAVNEVCDPVLVALSGSGNIEELVEAAGCAVEWSERAFRDERAAQCDIIRDILGNPFRPVPIAVAWRSPAVLGLADDMYARRDFSLMPILADALDDTGCTEEAVLQHGRGPACHVRGCWLIDRLRGTREEEEDLLDPHGVDTW